MINNKGDYSNVGPKQISTHDDHSHYTQYPAAAPLKTFKDLNQVFNSNLPTISQAKKYHTKRVSLNDQITIDRSIYSRYSQGDSTHVQTVTNYKQSAENIGSDNNPELKSPAGLVNTNPSLQDYMIMSNHGEAPENIDKIGNRATVTQPAIQQRNDSGADDRIFGKPEHCVTSRLEALP